MFRILLLIQLFFVSMAHAQTWVSVSADSFRTTLREAYLLNDLDDGVALLRESLPEEGIYFEAPTEEEVKAAILAELEEEESWWAWLWSDEKHRAVRRHITSQEGSNSTSSEDAMIYDIYRERAETELASTFYFRKWYGQKEFFVMLSFHPPSVGDLEVANEMISNFVDFVERGRFPSLEQTLDIELNNRTVHPGALVLFELFLSQPGRERPKVKWQLRRVRNY